MTKRITTAPARGQALKPYRVRVEVDIVARDAEQARQRAQLIYSDITAAGRPWVKDVLPDGIEERAWLTP